MPNKKTMKKGLQTHISYVNLTLENLMIEGREHDMKIVGERMKKLREEAGISQNKLAKLIGIQQSSLNRYESGFSNPTPETLLWFGDFFDVSMDYIFGRTDKPQGKMYKYKPRLDPDMMKFVEMCFEPGTRANRENGITILRHYIDRAFSAKTDNRPEFQNMIKDSGKKLFDMVIVWKLDRFARNRYDSARYKSLLKKNGIKVVSATEVISEGAEGIILESVLEGYAEYYSADLAEKVVRGMTDNALKCKFNGGTIPIGYVIDNEQHFQIDPITAPYVLEVFKRYDSGSTMTELRDWLNEEGVKNTRGNPITYNSIQHILNNRRYIGEFAFRDTVISDGIPAIVPLDLFDRVQDKLAVNKKAPARHKAEDDYLLTTKIFCGYCGAYLCGESGTSRTGEVHHYYKCVSVKKKRTACECKPVRKVWLENLVLDSIIEMLADDRTIDAITSMVLALQDQESTALPMYEQQLQEANTGINNLLNAIQQGILTKSTKNRLEELEAARDELENKIALEKLAKPRVSEEQVRFFLHRFRALDIAKPEQRKTLIDVFLNAVYVFNDKTVISCNYKDGTKTINFSDMECALSQRASVPGSDLDCPGAPRQNNTMRSPAAARRRPVD